MTKSVTYNNPNLLFYNSESSAGSESYEGKIKVSTRLHFFWRLQKRIVPFSSFQRPLACLGSWPLPPLQSTSLQPLILLFHLLFLILILLPPYYKDPCDFMQPAEILLRLSPHLKILNPICKIPFAI